MPLRIGIIGCGEIAQVAHIPNFNFMPDKFRVTYLCDVSRDALKHCAAMVRGGHGTDTPPKTTTNAEELCASPDVDAVLICSADEYHVLHATAAMAQGKWALVEKPLAMNFRDYDALLEAEKKAASKGARIFVGTMRRYAPALHEAIREVGGAGQVLHARVRSIIGPNSNFVRQSGTFPQVFSDISAADSDDRTARRTDMFGRALRDEFGVAFTPASTSQLSILGSLNSHDISAMRDILGMPRRVLGASLGSSGLYSALLDYGGFGVVFESGVHGVPTFDANIEVYAQDKIVRVQYDSPYVKGLPVTMTVREKIDSRPGKDDSFGYQERLVRRTYEDPYTLEMLEFYDCVVHGKPVKTTVADARQDLEIIQMIMRAGEHSYKS